jgi:hypothetical protein
MMSRTVGSALIVLFAVTCLVGCMSQGPVVPSEPVPGPPSGNFTLWEGTVWAHGETGVAPARGIRLGGWLEDSSGCGGTRGFITADVHGRFQVALPEGARRIRLFNGEHLQPCAVTVELGGRSPDVHLVVDLQRLGAHLPADLQSLQPTLSGVVFEQTPEGPRPLAGVRVELDAVHGLGVPIATTVTDADGRYVLCAVPYLPGLVLFASTAGFPLFEASVEPTRTVLDIELRRHVPQ